VPSVDVVVVSYNSSETLPDCISPLVGDSALTVTVADNASTDGSVDVARRLGATVVALEVNHGFAYGCNRGWELGSSPHVLFLNPDARMSGEDVRRLAATFEERPEAGLVAPRIVDEHGALDYSQRRFPRLRSTYAQALFLHRAFPRAAWTDEVIRDGQSYERPGSVDWVSGACLVARRDLLEQLGGWDEEFFHYGEDIDLCRRAWAAGYQVCYEPGVVAVHAGGGSAPRASLVPRLAASRVRYARLHRERVYAWAERGGIALGALTHAILSSQGSAVRKGHLRAFLVACSLAEVPR
jgi:GT2 family glycosyltransferase